MSSMRSSPLSWIRYDLGVRGVLLPEWRALLSSEHLREDVLAGVTVACVAVPLSLAIALASGVAPGVGLVTAIIAGVVCALFGGTRLSVSGPAAAMAVLIASVVGEHGVGGLLVVGVACGILQLATGVFGLGRLIRFVPVPVIEGFTAGIGAIILMGQLPRAFGLPPPAHASPIEVLRHLGDTLHMAHWGAFGLTMLSVVICVGLPKLFPKIPAPLVAVILPSIFVAVLGLNVPALGEIPRSLPAPRLPALPTHGLGDLLAEAVVVYALASLETLLSSTAVDKLASGPRHDPDQELIGQGLGNIAVALFGGIPVTGVIARSSLNVLAGAKTRRSSIIHSLVLVAAVYALAPVIARIPLAALAGVLLAVALRMLNPAHLKHLWKVSRSEASIYMVTFGVIVVGDLIVGVQAGLVMALFVAAVRMGQIDAGLDVGPDQVARVTLTGPLTFLSQTGVETLRKKLSEVEPLRGVMIDFAGVSRMDVTGAELMTQLVQQVESRDVKVAILRASHEHQTVLMAVDQSGRMGQRLVATEMDARATLDPDDRTRPVERLVSDIKRFQRAFADPHARTFARIADRQRPHTLFITCSDSAMALRLFTSTNPGELFVIRNLGNVITPCEGDATPAEGAALEYAVGVLGVREVIVCGHAGCSATHPDTLAHLDDLHGLGRWLRWIDREAARGTALDGDPGEVTRASDEIARRNVVRQLEHLRSYPVVAARVADGSLDLHGWFFDPRSGTVRAWSPAAGRWEHLIDVTDTVREAPPAAPVAEIEPTSQN